MRYVELFCGAGGTSCGLVDAGWECVTAVDWDDAALRIYAANFPSHPLVCHDLSQPLPLPQQCDVLVASSPCTDFSTANSAPRHQTSSLTATLPQHVAHLAPEWVLFENVPRARLTSEFRSFVHQLEHVHGFSCAYGVVCATDAGLAQMRKRLFLFAHRDATRAQAAWTHFSQGLRDEGRARGRVATMRECFAACGVACPRDHIYLPSCDEKRRKGVYTLDGPAPTVRGYVRPMRANYPFPPRDDTRDPSQLFAATPQHTAALQGFPPDYDWAGVKQTRRAKCIGNAVPPPLAARAARAIVRADRSASTPGTP